MSSLSQLNRSFDDTQTKNSQAISHPNSLVSLFASISFQLLKVIEDISTEKLLLEEKLLSLPLISQSKGFASIGLSEDTATSTKELSNSRALNRDLLQKLSQVTADFRIQSSKLMKTEKIVRELQEDKEIGDRLRTKVETQTENFDYQIALWEEKVEALNREINILQVRHNLD